MSISWDLMNQADLSKLSNAVMQEVQDRLKRENIWMGMPLRMSWQRDAAMACYFFILQRMNWNIVVKIQLDDCELQDMSSRHLVGELSERVMAALLLNADAGGVHRGHP